MKINIGDTVVPNYYLGTIVNIDETQVTIEYKNYMGDIRHSYLTEEQAKSKGKTLEQHVDDSLIIIQRKEYNE